MNILQSRHRPRAQDGIPIEQRSINTHMYAREHAHNYYVHALDIEILDVR